MGPIIVDTSVWINGLQGIQTKQVSLVAEYITADKRIHITPTILQEVLQGVRNDSQYEPIKIGMLANVILKLDPVDAAVEAAQLYRALRKKGITIRKPNDCLIAHYAIFYNIPVLHNDSDFDQIARFSPLRIVNP